MLTEQRFDIILKLLEEKKSVTVTELRELLDASESTVRRDITALDKAGKLNFDTYWNVYGTPTGLITKPFTSLFCKVAVPFSNTGM